MLLHAEPKLVIELFKLLRSHAACTDETVHQFLDTPRMRQHLSGNDWHLTRLGLRCPKNGPLPCLQHSGLLARFDREKLYEQVWSQPIRKLAPEYGVSDVALAKTCRKLQIPRPGRGYWAKLTAGQRVGRRPPLPLYAGSEGK
jgi:hypothetical protein